MASFASCRRAGWVRFLVVLLCALFLFATLGAPAARAEALTVGLFTAAAVLSAATAALGFKLANSADGQATLAKMVQDFKVSATAVGLVLVGSKINGLIDGVDYIKMQVKAGKTYLDERVVAWVQQWLAQNGAYSDGAFTSAIDVDSPVSSWTDVNLVNPLSVPEFANILKSYNNPFGNTPDWSNMYVFFYLGDPETLYFYACVDKPNRWYFIGNDSDIRLYFSPSNFYYGQYRFYYKKSSKSWRYDDFTSSFYVSPEYYRLGKTIEGFPGYNYINNIGTISSNQSGLSGTDTLGKDVVDLSLDQILQKLTEWAPDWWDAGADSSTNSAAGAKDLPLNMGSDVKTVTGNPALEVDQPLIYTSWFEETLDNLRNGETAGTVTNTATSAADTAEKAEVAQGTVEDAQDVVQSIISWGLDYISPDKGLFSRFPLCIPYDAYLLVTAALGVDARDLGEIVSQSPGELSALVDDGVDEQSDFVPVISVKHDWTQDGVTTPVEVTIDLRPYDAIIKMIRTLVSVYVIAELIASEYKRIRGA